jgi:hypothetical protein
LRAWLCRDASFLYGSTAEAEKRSRTFEGGKLSLPGGKLPIDEKGLCSLGDQHNPWIGVGCLQVRPCAPQPTVHLDVSKELQWLSRVHAA